MGADNMSAYKISIVPPNLIDYMWADIAPIIKRPIDLSHDEVTLEIAKKELESGGVSLVLITKGPQLVAINTLEVRTFPTGKKCMYIPLTGGDELDGWMEEFLGMVTATAKQHGCSHIRGLAVRKGWLRKLEGLGFEPISTTIEMEIPQ